MAGDSRHERDAFLCPGCLQKDGLENKNYYADNKVEALENIIEDLERNIQQNKERFKAAEKKYLFKIKAIEKKYELEVQNLQQSEDAFSKQQAAYEELEKSLKKTRKTIEDERALRKEVERTNKNLQQELSDASKQEKQLQINLLDAHEKNGLLKEALEEASGTNLLGADESTHCKCRPLTISSDYKVDQRIQ
ncbi:hypothetical protein Alg130_11156 [Pyrenophora tritici-repentis]|nr:hypothetical protein Alg130_11156 [Pyrenophora tritici-repentis]